MTALPLLRIRGRELLPIVQGAMGVGISAHRLAGSVAREGAMGTIASIDLRHHHPDLMAQCKSDPSHATLEAANQTALSREIGAAKALSGGRGMIAVNVMRAVASYADAVRTACESGADAIVVGAGLPLDLPELTQGHDIALIPILSDSRGIALVLKKWMKKNRLPDAIVIEHPAHAGGHLGVANLDDIGNARFDFARVIEETMQTFETLGIEPGRIPLIVAGGINSHTAVRSCLAAGASGVQLGTAFAVTREGDAHPNFKRILADAMAHDIVDFVSVTGLPARAVKTPWLMRYLRNEQRIRDKIAAAARPARPGSIA
jgi:nitronate monooxygenase